MLCWPLMGAQSTRPPKAPPNDSTASATSQGHGAPLHRPQDCPTGESLCIASMVSPTGVLTPQCETPGPPLPPRAVVDIAYLTPSSGHGEVASCLEESPVPLAPRPKERNPVDCSPCSTGTVATVRASRQSSIDSVTAQVENPTCLERSPVRRKRPGIPPPSNAGATSPRKCAKAEPGTKTGPMDCDAPLASWGV